MEKHVAEPSQPVSQPSEKATKMLYIESLVPAATKKLAIDSTEAKSEPQPSTTLRATKFGESNLFPQVLYHVLNECSNKDFIETGIRWTSDGLQIQIGRPQFVNNTLGKYFNTTKYNSFTRNLNLYGFKKCKIYSGIYSHPDYRRDNFSLIKNMRRPKVGPGKGEKRGRPSQQSAQPSGGKKQKLQAAPSKTGPENCIRLPEKRPPSRPNLPESLVQDNYVSPQTPRYHPQTTISPCGAFHERKDPSNVMDYELSMVDAAYILSSVCRRDPFSSRNEQCVK